MIIDDSLVRIIEFVHRSIDTKIMKNISIIFYRAASNTSDWKIVSMSTSHSFISTVNFQIQNWQIHLQGVFKHMTPNLSNVVLFYK